MRTQLKKIKVFQTLGEKAFTLLEVMIVVIIIATIMTMAIPRLSSENQKIKADIRRFSVLARRVLQEAQLKKNTYRLVIDMGSKDDNEENKAHSYWIESATSSSARASDEDTQSNDDSEKKTSRYQKDSSLLKTPKKLPENYIFSEVSFSDKDSISEGKAYVYFFPQGFTEECLIKIANKKEKDIHWSLLINPLTGYVDILSQDISMKDLKQGN